jgi:hypothetical protein
MPRPPLCVTMAEHGLGLAYSFEPFVAEAPARP